MNKYIVLPVAVLTGLICLSCHNVTADEQEDDQSVCEGCTDLLLPSETDTGIDTATSEQHDADTRPVYDTASSLQLTEDGCQPVSAEYVLMHPYCPKMGYPPYGLHIVESEEQWANLCGDSPAPVDFEVATVVSYNYNLGSAALDFDRSTDLCVLNDDTVHLNANAWNIQYDATCDCWATARGFFAIETGGRTMEFEFTEAMPPAPSDDIERTCDEVSFCEVPPAD